MDSVAALFDMDYTLLTQSSGRLYLQYLRRHHLLSRTQLARLGLWVVLYKLSMMDYPHMMARLMTMVAGGREEESIAQARDWFGEMVIAHIAERGREKVEAHRQQGHTVAIVTASTPYIAQTLTDYLGLGDNYLCTYLEVQAGRFTGRLIEPPCYGPGKVVLARRFAEERGLDLSQSFFYSDGYSDHYLLEAVGHPVVVNPEPKLRRLAQKRGWPIEHFY